MICRLWFESFKSSTFLTNSKVNRSSNIEANAYSRDSMFRIPGGRNSVSQTSAYIVWAATTMVH